MLQDMTLHVWNSKYRLIATSMVALTQWKFKVVDKQWYFLTTRSNTGQLFLGLTITFLKTDSVLVFIFRQTSDTLSSLIFVRLYFHDLKNVMKFKSYKKKVPWKLKTQNLATYSAPVYKNLYLSFPSARSLHMSRRARVSVQPMSLFLTIWLILLN